MSARILDGDSLSKRLLAQLAPRAAAVAAERGAPPLLALVSIGGNGASSLYMRKKLEACHQTGIESSVQALPSEVSEVDVFTLIAELSRHSGVDGIIIETPLPRHLNLSRILERLPAEKDVEGVGPGNFGKLFTAKSLTEIEESGALLPPTPQAILQLLAESQSSAKEPSQLDAASVRRALERAGKGKEAVVLGRSTIVGRPVAHLLSCIDATVTLCHSATRDLKSHLRRSDIVVSAVGTPRIVRGEDLKAGAVVIDAGIGYEGKRLCGDADPESVPKVAGCVSPVPGGVGPVTVAMMLSNIVTTAERRLRAGA